MVITFRLVMTALAGLLLALSMIMTGAAQERPFIDGTIVWSSSVPAQGLEVRLVREGQTAASAFTDAAGYFAFYGVPGQPSQYRINVLTAGGIVAEVPLSNMPMGARLPPITLK